MADSTWGSVTLLIRSSDRGDFALPEMVGTPVIRTPNLSGGSNVQTGGYSGLGYTCTLEFDVIGDYNALYALRGNAASLALRPGARLFVYPNMVLEMLSAPAMGPDGVITATARFTSDG